MKESTEAVRKEIFRNNNDMKREHKKNLDGLDAKLSKNIGDVRTNIEGIQELFDAERKLTQKMKQKVETNEKLMETKIEVDKKLELLDQKFEGVTNR